MIFYEVLFIPLFRPVIYQDTSVCMAHYRLTEDIGTVVCHRISRWVKNPQRSFSTDLNVDAPCHRYLEIEAQ